MTRVVRGLYGPLPSELLSPGSRRQSVRALWVAATAGRHFAGLRPITKSEHAIAAEAAAAARFAAWIPTEVPSGFSIVGADLVPYGRDVLTMRLSREAREFEIAQRRRWLPIDEELSTASLPFDIVPLAPGPLYLVHGKHGGEPIDLSFWSTRRALVFERGDLRIECREVVGRGPGLSALIRFAAHTIRNSQAPGLDLNKLGETHDDNQ